MRWTGFSKKSIMTPSFIWKVALERSSPTFASQRGMFIAGFPMFGIARLCASGGAKVGFGAVLILSSHSIWRH